jgi:hypothetical protein
MTNRLVVDGAALPAPGQNDALIRTIACGRAWFEELASGRGSSFSEIAARVRVTDRYVSRIVDLAFRAPMAASMPAVRDVGHRSFNSPRIRKAQM